MKEIVVALTSTPFGLAILAISIIGIVVLVVFLVRRGYVLKRDDKGKIVGITKGDKKKILDSSMLILDINEIIDHTEEKIRDIRDDTLREIRRVQKDAMAHAIQTMCLEFTSQLKDENVSTIIETLELYLQRDFIKILAERLDEYRSSPNFIKKSEQDITQEVQLMTEDCIGKMKLKIKNYILIGDQKALVTLFENSKRDIGNTLDSTIKNFLKLSKDEQDKLLELAKQRANKISEKIKSICEE